MYACSCRRAGRSGIAAAAILAWCLGLSSSAWAFEAGDMFSGELALRGIVQHGSYDDAFDENGREIDDTTRGAAIVDLALEFTPGEAHLFYLWARWAEGNSLNAPGVPVLAPYGGDLEDDVRDINGDGRDYLLEAWYRYTFGLGEERSLGATFGLVDTSVYISDNKYVGDPDIQFMNEAFVGTNSAELPAYEPGAVLELEAGPWSVRGLVMEPETDDGDDYTYYAAQVGMRTDSGLGEGNWRLFGFYTDAEFAPADGSGSKERGKGVGISVDHELGDTFGAFVRVGKQDDDRAVDFDALYSAGLNINGRLWGRGEDEAGLALAYLDGADESDFDDSLVAEGYARFQLLEQLDLTFDIQYVEDDLVSGPDPEVWMFGTRINLVL